MLLVMKANKELCSMATLFCAPPQLLERESGRFVKPLEISARHLAIDVFGRDEPASMSLSPRVREAVFVLRWDIPYADNLEDIWRVLWRRSLGREVQTVFIGVAYEPVEVPVHQQTAAVDCQRVVDCDVVAAECVLAQTRGRLLGRI